MITASGKPHRLPSAPPQPAFQHCSLFPLAFPSLHNQTAVHLPVWLFDLQSPLPLALHRLPKNTNSIWAPHYIPGFLWWLRR